jgi:hypothetical protein
MSDERPIDDGSQHQEISSLIPWYVNGTIGDVDRQRLDSHLQACAACRDDLLLERRVHASMAADAPVEYMPTASLKRLQASLDAPGAGAAPAGVTVVAPMRRARVPWQGWMAASIAALAVAFGLLAVDRWMELRARRASPAYYTVTTPAAKAPDAVIRAVFSPTVTLAELQAILGEAQLRIVAGPTEAGVYSLASNSSRPVSLSLSLLRQHTEVRFAEITQPNARAGVSP